MSTFEKILPYVTALLRKDGDYSVFVNFRKEWKVLPNEEKHISAMWSNDYESWVYQAHEKEVSFDDLCVYIQYTIDVNKEAEAKSRLFEQKQKELSALFREKSLVELEGLNFNITKPVAAVAANGRVDVAPVTAEAKAVTANDGDKKKSKK